MESLADSWSELGRTGAGSVGFSLWLGMVLATLETTALRPLKWEAATFLMGVHLAMSFPTVYLLLCRVGLLAVLLSVIVGSQERWDSLTQHAPPNVRPLCKRLWPLMSQMGSLCVLFLSWYPACIPWKRVVRLVLATALLAGAHIMFLTQLHFEDEQLESFLAFWVTLRRQMWTRRWRLAAGVTLCVACIWWIHLALLLFLICLGGCAGAALLSHDTGLSEDIEKRLQRVLKPWRAVQTALSQTQLGEELLTPLMASYVFPWMRLSHLWEQRERKEVKDVLRLWTPIGLAFGFFLLLASWFSTFTGSLLLLSVVSFIYAARPDDAHFGRFFSTSAAILAILTLQLVLTGRVLAFPVMSQLTPLKVLWTFVFYVIWGWLVALLIILHVLLYRGSATVRWLVLQIWWSGTKKASRLSQRSLEVPHNPLTILAPSLAQLSPDPSDFKVAFQQPHPFNLDAVDMNGLSKEWASLISRALDWPLRVGDHEAVWNLLTKLDDRSEVYHLNYEAYSAQVYDAIDLDVDGLFQRLGALVGKCLLKRFCLKPLSLALVKYILRDEADDVDDLKITFSDFEEVCPSMAKHMKEPATRQYVDFDQVTLPNQGHGQFDVKTGFTKDMFTAPTADTWQGLAKAILECDYLLKPLKEFKAGFRGVLSVNLDGVLDAREVQRLLAGGWSVDVDDWQQHSVVHEASPTHPTVKLLWSGLKGRSQEELQNFLEFATGNMKLPHGGFAQLRPMFKIRVVKGIKDIQAHTCFNSIDIPAEVDPMVFRSSLDDKCKRRE